MTWKQLCIYLFNFIISHNNHSATEEVRSFQLCILDQLMIKQNIKEQPIIVDF